MFDGYRAEGTGSPLKGEISRKSARAVRTDQFSGSRTLAQTRMHAMFLASFMERHAETGLSAGAGWI